MLFWPPMLVVWSSETPLQWWSKSVCKCIGYFDLNGWDTEGNMDTSFGDWTKVSRKQKMIHDENRGHDFAWNATAHNWVYHHSSRNISITFKLDEALDPCKFLIHLEQAEVFPWWIISPCMQLHIQESQTISGSQCCSQHFLRWRISSVYRYYYHVLWPIRR